MTKNATAGDVPEKIAAETDALEENNPDEASPNPRTPPGAAKKQDYPNFGEAGLLAMGVFFLVEVEVAGIATAAFLWVYWQVCTAAFWGFLPDFLEPWLPWALLPLAVIVALYVFVLVAALVARAFLACLKKPKEGVFAADYKARDGGYKQWALRGATRRIPLWAFYLTPVWEGQRVLLGILGRTKLGKDVVLSEKVHVDPELVEIGDYAFIGLGTTILSHSIDGDTIELARVKIGKGVLVGANSIINAGAEIGDGAVIASGSVVRKHQKIPANSLYGGNPCVEIKKHAREL